MSMTNVSFSLRRVVMAVQRVKQLNEIQSKTANYELLEDILHSITAGVEDQKHNFELYVKSAKAEGLTPAQTWKLAKEILSSHVSLRTLYRWGHEYLTEDAFMEVRQRANYRRHNIFLPKGDKLQCQQESCAEAYEIDKVKAGAYTYEYLQSVAIWLHECLELNCQKVS